jgi:hypothetical protein
MLITALCNTIGGFERLERPSGGVWLVVSVPSHTYKLAILHRRSPDATNVGLLVISQIICCIVKVQSWDRVSDKFPVDKVAGSEDGGARGKGHGGG